LANSYKHRNRCVAGFDLQSREWVRPVSPLTDGCLEPRHYRLNDHTEARPLDVIEIDLEAPCARNCHPEDWLLSSREWILLRRPLDPADWKTLESAISKTPAILGSYRDRLYASAVKQRSLRESLTIVRPDDLWWWIRESNGRRRYRALFRQDRIRYELALTDPVWIAQLALLPDGIHEHVRFFTVPAPETLLTISLSEEFDGFHYKLAAGVVVKPSFAP
jgi:hypothetical protein